MAHAESPDALEQLARRQNQLADKFVRFETLMLKMADLDAASNPRRAILLRRAVEQSNERQVRLQLKTLVDLITEDELDHAVVSQNDLVRDLEVLLDLLLSENRAQHLQDEQARIRTYMKEVERILRLQRSLQGQTEESEQPKLLPKQQKKIAERAARLNQQMRENEERPAESDQSDDGTNGESQDSRDLPTEEGPAPSGQNTPPNKSEESESHGPTDRPDGSPSPGKPGSSSESPPSEQPQPSYAPRKRVAEAQQQMEQAHDRLEQDQQREAIENQDKAQEQLRKAIAELEEILRQTREEEVERTLLMLEARFRRMLELQVKVLEETKRLDQVPTEQRNFELNMQAAKISFEQRKILLAADRALTLLREEGSSIAFPEVVGQARDDMEQVAARLAKAEVGLTTQGIEQDIIDALQEMIEALQQAQKKRENQAQQQPSQSMASAQDQGLVDLLSELKMIRSMESRVYRRTKHYAGLLEDSENLAGQATDPELLSVIRRLGKRQQRIHEITRDLVLEKNK
ncbi:MAG: hypothetical protein CMJ81_16525 [Planctomycetaceae bacterium]|nr:hypothetical protein [Planctomycetaceae bacterium]